jgi:hypothetical protein
VQIVWILKQPHNLLFFLCFNIDQKLKTRIATKIKSDKQATKKRKIVSHFLIIKFFNNQHLYNKVDLAQHLFLKDFLLYVAKG